MIDLLDSMLAAKDGDRFGWIIPLALFAFYILSAISKGKAQKEYDEKLDEKLDAKTKPSKYKELGQEPETIHITPPKEILQKKLRVQQALAAQAKPKPKPRMVKRPAPQPVARHIRSQEETKPQELEILPEIPESMIENIRQPQTIRDAIVFSEIIGKPRSLNQWQY